MSPSWVHPKYKAFLLQYLLKKKKKKNLVNLTCYEKSQDLTPSILPAKSDSLHQCEMNNKVER